MIYPGRYKRNGTTIPDKLLTVLKEKRVLIVGCGGLGGYIIEMLARAGVGNITAVDPDVFDETNLNRQILCQESLIGTAKSEAAVQRVQTINSEVSVTGIQEALDETNAKQIVEGHDIVIDALDNIPTRFTLQKAAEQLQIPIVHGAISGWYGQVAVIYPGDRLFDIIYQNYDGEALDDSPGNPSFSPAAIASFQVSECIKVLTGNKNAMKGQILFIDMQEPQTNLVELSR